MTELQTEKKGLFVFFFFPVVLVDLYYSQMRSCMFIKDHAGSNRIAFPTAAFFSLLLSSGQVKSPAVSPDSFLTETN